MRKLILSFVLTAVISFSAANPSWAQPFTLTVGGDVYDSTPDAVSTPRDNNDNLAGVPDPADINDAINLLLVTSYARNEDVDSLQWTAGDSTWKDLSDADNDGTFILISLTAANTNTLSVYDVATPGTKLPVLGPATGFGYTGDGTVGSPFTANVSPIAPGINFGWSLRSAISGPDFIWDSNPALNPDGLDHMLTYHLKDLNGQTKYIKIGAAPAFAYKFNDPYLITWEDKPLEGGLLGDEDYDDMLFLVDRVAPIPEPISMVLFGSGLLSMMTLRKRKA